MEMKPSTRHRGEDRPEVALAEEVAVLGRREHRRDDDDQAEHDVDELGRGERGRTATTAAGRPSCAGWRWRCSCGTVLGRSAGGERRAPAPRSHPAGSSPASRPSRITRMRSDMPITSGSSLETIRIGDAVGGAACASARRRACLAPTSMPRVGSSISTTRGSMLSQRASTTFCWLPPERNCTSWSSPRAETSRLGQHARQLAARGAGAATAARRGPRRGRCRGSTG